MQVYAVCHSFKSFLNLIELLELGTGIKLWGEKMNVVVAISHFCITFNSSVNFAIYCSKERCHSNKSLGNMFMYTNLVNLTKHSFLAQMELKVSRCQSVSLCGTFIQKIIDN